MIWIHFRNAFYNLFPGNWNFKIADLGNLPNGNSVNDTYFAITDICDELYKSKILSQFWLEEVMI